MILKIFDLKLVYILIYLGLFESQRFTSTAAPSWNLDEIGNQECGKPSIVFSRIYYGIETRHGEYPWNAALIHRNTSIGFFCGGTLVSTKLIITAAHCIEGKGGAYFFKPRDIVVELGAHNISNPLEDGKITASVKATHIHHDWNPHVDSYDADIAILELFRPVHFDEYVQPICLAESGSEAASINVGYVVGFGKSEKTIKEDIARIVGTPIHSNRVCGTNSQIHQQLVSNRGFCGGFANGTGVCTGDSGSGLIVLHEGTYYLRGIVSASLGGGIEGCNLHKYSIFTDILGFYGWITTGKDDKILIRELLEEIRRLKSNVSYSQVTSSTIYVRPTQPTTTTIECGTRPLLTIGLIQGGTFVSRGEFPWNVALIHRSIGMFCGGTLVSNRHVVTAAHCLKGKNESYNFGPEDFSVLLGVHNYKKADEFGRISAEIKSISVAEYWATRQLSYDGDIALLELANEVQFSNYITPICIADYKSEVAEASEGTVVGFGHNKKGTHSDIATKLEISILDFNKCTINSSYHQTFASPRTFCGGPADGSGVCDNGSGSGVYVKHDDVFYLRGIVAASLVNNNNECDTHKKAIFTNVPFYYELVKSGRLYISRIRTKRFLQNFD